MDNIIFSGSIHQLKCLFWQGQPVYQQYPKIKNYIRQHVSEEAAAIFAEPLINEDEKNKPASWISETVDSSAVSFEQLPEEKKQAAELKIGTSISELKEFLQKLLESENAEDNRWGQLISKALDIPSRSSILVQGNKFILINWGFQSAGDNNAGFNLKRDFTNRVIAKTIEEKQSFIEPAPKETITETTPATSDLSPQNEKQLKGQEVGKANSPLVKPNLPPNPDTPPSGPKTNTGGDVKRNKRSIFLWIIAAILLLLLSVLLFKSCNRKHNYLPRQEGKIVPIDTLKIKNDSADIRKVVSDRINVSLIGGNTDIQAFADKFKSLYPGDDYSIIYYKNATHHIQLQVPAAVKDKVKNELKEKMPDFKMRTFDEAIMGANNEPNDPAFHNDANMDWFQLKVKAPEAWDITQGNPDIVIAILDGGFDLNHEEFQGKIFKPWNVPNDNADVNKGGNSGHGTHVAGIALANADNNKGTSGIAPKCTFMPVQLGDINGTMSYMSIINGFQYAVDNGADVINMSLGMMVSNRVKYLPPEKQRELINSAFKDEEEFWDQLFDIAYQKNVVIVLAAGNDNLVIGLDPMSRSNKTIKVSAVGQDNEKAAFSNYGENSTISAPGVGIYSSVPNNRYDYMSGTSMASPVVAGSVALIKSVNPSLSFNQIVDLMQTTGIPVDPSNGEVGNILQLDKALGIAQQGRQQMPIADCPDVQSRIDSMLQEIERLREECNSGSVTRDTLKIPTGVNTDVDFAVGRWKSTTPMVRIQDGQKITLFFDFYKNGKGKLTLLQSDNTQCEATLSLSLNSDNLQIIQDAPAICQPPPLSYRPYIFQCKPGANNCVECEAQNQIKSNNKLTFNLVRIN